MPDVYDPQTKVLLDQATTAAKQIQRENAPGWMAQFIAWRKSVAAKRACCNDNHVADNWVQVGTTSVFAAGTTAETGHYPIYQQRNFTATCKHCNIPLSHSTRV